MAKLKREEIINESGICVTDGQVRPISNDEYIVTDMSVGGDAPKDVIRVYEYKRGEIRKDRENKWPLYIAKVGQKWYPNESITEHLMTRIGEEFGFNMADSRLVKINDQVRFLSRHFLSKNEKLVHGAQIFGGYLNDKEFVEEVRYNRKSKDVFTFEFIVESVYSIYDDSVAEEICRDYVRMLAFDAIAGNNDRHHANWGVIQHVLGERKPVFAPIYDSARGLFWNHPDDRLRQKLDSRADEVENYVSSYVEGATPMTSWTQDGSVNHFELLQSVLQAYPEYEPILRDHYRPEAFERVEDELLKGEFEGLMCPSRKRLIIECLRERLDRFRKVLNG